MNLQRHETRTADRDQSTPSTEHKKRGSFLAGLPYAMQAMLLSPAGRGADGTRAGDAREPGNAAVLEVASAASAEAEQGSAAPRIGRAPEEARVRLVRRREDGVFVEIDRGRKHGFNRSQTAVAFDGEVHDVEILSIGDASAQLLVRDGDYERLKDASTRVSLSGLSGRRAMREVRKDKSAAAEARRRTARITLVQARRAPGVFTVIFNKGRDQGVHRETIVDLGDISHDLVRKERIDANETWIMVSGTSVDALKRVGRVTLDKLAEPPAKAG